MMATTRMITAARAALGTPFHHQGRAIGVGLDCIGLVIVALRAAGVSVQDRQDYSLRPDGRALAAALVAHGAWVATTRRAGDVLLFRFDHQPQHVALATTPTTLIHAFAPAGRVVETGFDASWRYRLCGIYRFFDETSDDREGA